MGEGQDRNSTIRFGDYEVDRCSGELRKRGVRIKLQEQPFKVLVTLLEHPGQVVTREELQKRIWPGESFGDFDHAVNVAVAKLRNALSDSVLVPRFIETLHRRGYRFVGAIESKGLGISAEPVAQPQTRAKYRIRSEVASLLSLAAILVLSATVWRIVVSRKPAPSVRQRILTASSSDNAVETPYISPDGKYVAFATTKGLFLQKIASGELRQLAKDWNPEVVGWFPDGDRLLLSDCRKRIVCGLYALSLTSGARQWLLDGGANISLSHNGLTIAFIQISPRAGELWLADSNGENPRKIAQLDREEEFLGVEWAPNDAQLLLLRRRVRVPSEETMLEIRDLQGRLSSTLVKDGRLQIQGASGFCWTRDGRILYSLLEEAPNHSSIWSITVNPQTGLPRDKPALIQDFPGFGVNNLNTSADGKRLTYTIWRDSPALYVGELEHGSTQLNSIRPMLTDYWVKTSTAWSSDSKSLFFQSNRMGHSSLYKLSVGNKTVEEVLSGADAYTSLEVSPNQKWLLFWAEKIGNGGNLKRLQRQPIEGGAIETVLTSNVRSEFSCSSAKNRCFLRESALEKGGRLEYVLLAFDPMTGNAREFTRVVVPTTDGGDYPVPREERDFGVSPDGQTIALVFGTNEVMFISATTGASWRFSFPGLGYLQKISWFADSKKVLVSTLGTGSRKLLVAVDLKGQAVPLLQNRVAWHVSSFELSPDGHYLAWVEITSETNVGMLENF